MVGTHCDQDIDECKTGTFACGIKEKCVNIPGSAICECMEGYYKFNDHCQGKSIHVFFYLFIYKYN